MFIQLGYGYWLENDDVILFFFTNPLMLEFLSRLVYGGSSSSSSVQV